MDCVVLADCANMEHEAKSIVKTIIEQSVFERILISGS
jgi:hypothetical protein